MSCSGSHFGILINLKNTKFAKNFPMIDAQFRFNQCNSSYGENVSKRFFSETTWTIETKLPRNNHWKVLYIFMFYMPIGNPRWPPPQYID
jgi:hypothetical protein